MKVIKLIINKIKIEKYSPKDKAIDLAIFFNDGADKEILKTVEINDPDTLAEFIISEIRKTVKQAKGDVVPVTSEDEEKLAEKMSVFFSKVAEKIENIKKAKVAEGYIQLIREINSMQLSL